MFGSVACPEVEVQESLQNTLSPEPIATAAFHDAAVAVVRLTEIYERNTEFLQRHFAAYLKGKRPARRVRACYPFVRITTGTFARVDLRLSYGFVSSPGVHETTVTRPDLFRRYFTEQIGLLLDNHGVPVEIGELREPIPVHFAYRRDIGSEAGFLDAPPEQPLRDFFDTPDLAAMDDAIVDGTLELPRAAPVPLALFRAARVDYSLHRLYHYTGTDPEYFQNFASSPTTSSTPTPSRRSAAPASRPVIRAEKPSSSRATASRAMRGSDTPGQVARRLSACRKCQPSISSSPIKAGSR